MSSLKPHPLLLGSLALLAGCRTVSTPGTSFASEPPGARVYVDGRDSGWVTPCMIALDHDAQHSVTLALAGYQASELMVLPSGRLELVSWSQGVNGLKSTIIFPILLPAEDLLLPLVDVEGTSPGRVFVRLRPEGAP